MSDSLEDVMRLLQTKLIDRGLSQKPLYKVLWGDRELLDGCLETRTLMRGSRVVLPKGTRHLTAELRSHYVPRFDSFESRSLHVGVCQTPWGEHTFIIPLESGIWALVREVEPGASSTLCDKIESAIRNDLRVWFRTKRFASEQNLAGG